MMSLGVGNFAIRDKSWRYIRYQNGNEELYDVLKDPGEFTNLADNADYASVIQRLEQYIPDNFVELYDHRSLQFTNMDTMKVFID